MKFKIDENLPLELADILRDENYDATTATAEGLSGKTDDAVLEVCKREERILITLDLDFSNVAAYPPRNYPGFIVLRPHHQDKQHLINLFRRLVPLLSVEPAPRRLWIVDESRIRIR